MTDSIEIDVDDQGRLALPDEAMAWLGQARRLYLCRSADEGTAMLSARDPRAGNERILDELAEVNRAFSDEDYFAPVPDSLLNR